MSSPSDTVYLDRDELLSSIAESALRAASDPSVTAVLRGYDYFEPGDTAQPLLPFLSVSVSDAEELVHGGGLWSALLTVTCCIHWSASVRDTLASIRSSVRSVMYALKGTSYGGMSLDGVREQSCRTPDFTQTTGDVVLTQVLTYRVWFEYPPVPPAVLDRVPYLIAHDPASGATYVTTQAQDPRRIERWLPGPGTLSLSYAFGAWQDRASLAYSSPVTPLSTSVPQPLSTT